MKAFVTMWLAGCMGIVAVRGADDYLDRLDDALSWSTADGNLRARFSGLLDLEGYTLPHPAPGVIDANTDKLFNPRLALFVDSQMGQNVYVFAQGRVDRGFDPSNDPLTARLDEYAIRWAADGGHFHIQIGKFATIVGNWTARHDSWSNPFITAPLPYENLTGIWDSEPPHSSSQLLVWSHQRPGLPPAITANEKYLRIPIVWGPSYTTGLAVAGELDRFHYAIEIKNASLSSRPQTWESTNWSAPTVGGRVSYLPDESWEFGMSASTGSFLRPSAAPFIDPMRNRRDYRQVVLGQDVSFAWHHLQIWAEVYETRFEVPTIGDAETLAYYLEAKYKWAPRFSTAVRWNHQLFGSIYDRGVAVAWEHNVWRVDFAPAYRLTPHVQLKMQYSLQRGGADNDEVTHLIGVQATVRF